MLGQSLEQEATRSVAERGAEPLDHDLGGETARTAPSRRTQQYQPPHFHPRAGPTQEEEFELLEEQSLDSGLALFDTIHRKHPDDKSRQVR